MKSLRRSVRKTPEMNVVLNWKWNGDQMVLLGIQAETGNPSLEAAHVHQPPEEPGQAASMWPCTQNRSAKLEAAGYQKNAIIYQQAWVKQMPRITGLWISGVGCNSAARRLMIIPDGMWHRPNLAPHFLMTLRKQTSRKRLSSSSRGESSIVGSMTNSGSKGNWECQHRSCCRSTRGSAQPSALLK